jgi:hypothetical protein
LSTLDSLEINGAATTNGGFLSLFLSRLNRFPLLKR